MSARESSAQILPCSGCVGKRPSTVRMPKGVLAPLIPPLSFLFFRKPRFCSYVWLFPGSAWKRGVFVVGGQTGLPCGRQVQQQPWGFLGSSEHPHHHKQGHQVQPPFPSPSFPVKQIGFSAVKLPRTPWLSDAGGYVVPPKLRDRIKSVPAAWQCPGCPSSSGAPQI